MKKIIGVFLALSMILCNFSGISSSDALSVSSKNKLKKDVAYYADLNGNGKKEKIMIKHVREDGFPTVKLYVNSKLKKKYGCDGYPSVYLCDFNKSDKKKDIYVYEECAGTGGFVYSYIFRYNKSGGYKNYTYDGKITSYNNKTGEIKLEYGISSQSAFKSFEKAFGGEFRLDNYLKVNKDSITKLSKKTTKVYNDKFGYQAQKKLTAYTSTSGTKKAFTVNQYDQLYMQQLYSSNGEKYIKLQNENGQSGWIKVGNSLLF